MILGKPSQFSERMLAFMRGIRMSSMNRHLIFLVLLNVLLVNNCGYVEARPNATNSLYGAEHQSNVRMRKTKFRFKKFNEIFKKKKTKLDRVKKFKRTC
jgi:hypothetical protein